MEVVDADGGEMIDGGDGAEVSVDGEEKTIFIKSSHPLVLLMVINSKSSHPLVLLMVNSN